MLPINQNMPSSGFCSSPSLLSLTYSSIYTKSEAGETKNHIILKIIPSLIYLQISKVGIAV